ncbi:MAG: hypothetical protein U1E15_04925 [Hyphomicrobiales bacterium]
MKKHWRFLALAALLATAAPASAGSVNDADMVALQAAMQSHIDSTLVDGAVLSIDQSTGDITKLYPGKAHPKLMIMGDKYVLCANFMDEAGNMVMGNFYMARNGSQFVVFASTFGPDALLERLMADGKVAAGN